MINKPITLTPFTPPAALLPMLQDLTRQAFTVVQLA